MFTITAVGRSKESANKSGKTRKTRKLVILHGDSQIFPVPEEELVASARSFLILPIIVSLVQLDLTRRSGRIDQRSS